MPGRVEFLFDVGSPASYVAWKRMPALIAETGAQVDFVPILLGGVFKSTGNVSPAAVPAKGRWMLQDLQRFARRHGFEYRPNPHFPINTLHLMRGATALREDERFLPYVDAVFDGMFLDPRNLGDPQALAPVLAEAGIGGDEFMALIEREDVKARLKAETENAVARGVFGAPTFFVGEEMFFGQDRLDFVAESLAS